MRVASVDLGTNSIRLLVTDVDDGRLDDVVRRQKVTRLGEGVDERKRLLPAPIARARNVLVDFRREIEDLGAERTLLVATSAVRDAENGEAFLGEIEWSYGFATRLLSGDEEAQLTFRGAAVGRDLAEETLLVDIGGGSTEFVVGGPDGLRFHESVDFGSVRLTERFLHTDPPTADELDACVHAARELLAERIPGDLRPRTAIGVAGTITSIAALDRGLEDYDPEQVHGHRLSRAGIAAQFDRLAALPLAERRQVPALDPDRAPVIVAGALILQEALQRFGLDGIEASEHDLLDGAALEAAKIPDPEEGAAPPGAYTCC